MKYHPHTDDLQVPPSVQIPPQAADFRARMSTGHLHPVHYQPPKGPRDAPSLTGSGWTGHWLVSRRHGSGGLAPPHLEEATCRGPRSPQRQRRSQPPRVPAALSLQLARPLTQAVSDVRPRQPTVCSHRDPSQTSPRAGQLCPVHAQNFGCFKPLREISWVISLRSNEGLGFPLQAGSYPIVPPANEAPGLPGDHASHLCAPSFQPSPCPAQHTIPEIQQGFFFSYVYLL